MKKIVMLLFTAAALVFFCFSACAEETKISYHIEYEGDQATVYFQSESLSAFDFGFIYDPAEVTIEDIVYSDYYQQLVQTSGNSVMAVENPAAQDDEGNTYVVVTGIAMNGSSGEPLQFSSTQEIAHIVISGISEGDIIGVVSETASVKDVRNANKIAAVDLSKQQEVTDSDIFAGAQEEPEDNAGGDNYGEAADNSPDAENGAGNDTWIYVLVIAAVIIVVAVLIVISKKGHAAIEESEPETPEEELSETQDE